eukprot:CAMPEP_0170805720 /NCGR_PEP_ID=MMETSP0733-20121128/31550_1 /TAXON_ID=186038 /ORGANISM="Fragilariopsis kerguelensis, Strain L26-C5" /LENGTH=245 /DNA_ID=CAMNT_0011160179 /DNA_START=418 /DNA_END=1155 /DNA_ORIENTATION=-
MKQKTANDIMKAKRFVELRKKKMKQILVTPPPPIKQVKALPFSRNKPPQLQTHAAEAPEPHTTIHTTETRTKLNDMSFDCDDVILQSSSTMSSLGGPPKPPPAEQLPRKAPELPSVQIRNHFARTSQSYEDMLTENGSVCGGRSIGSSNSRPGETGRNKLQRAIAERREKASEVCGHNEEDDENNNTQNSGPFPASKKDLRSIYQQYLDGQVEKESVMRTGDQWTQGYRSRRYQEHEKHFIQDRQ